jgi:predicted porin
MKKSLIAVAVAGLFAAPAAMAEVTLSGAINLAPTYIKSSSGAGGGESTSSTSLANNYSHIDIDSTDDIGDGNKIIFKYQMVANTGSLGDSPSNRNSYLGVTGGWGTFKMGTNENVYERFMYESDPLDGAVGVGGNIQMLGHSGQQGAAWFAVGNTAGDQFWRRTDNTIWYTSPDLSGFTFEIDQTLSAHKDNAADTDPTITSAGVQWKPEAAPFFLNGAVEIHRDVANSLGGTDNKARAWQIGGGWSFGDLSLVARYEQIKYEATGGVADTAEVTHMWLGAKFNLPSGYIGGEIGIAPKFKLGGDDVDNSEASMYSVGYFHNLSKQSQLQFIATHISNDDNVAYGIGAGAGSTSDPGADHTAFTVGIKHTF